MGYIRNLRQYVGHQPLLIVGATVLVLNHHGEVLMIRRSDTGDWGVPGGSMELGETIEQAARRELREETNLEAGALTLFDVFSGPELDYCYPNGDETSNVSVVYLTYDVRGRISLNDGEHTEYRYFPLSDLPPNIAPPIKLILKALSQRMLA